MLQKIVHGGVLKQQALEHIVFPLDFNRTPLDGFVGEVIAHWPDLSKIMPRCLGEIYQRKAAGKMFYAIICRGPEGLDLGAFENCLNGRSLPEKFALVIGQKKPNPLVLNIINIVNKEVTLFIPR